jgi:hypothetical protein
MQIPNHRVEKLIDDLESASAYIDFRSDCNQSLVDGLNAHADYLMPTEQNGETRQRLRLAWAALRGRPLYVVAPLGFDGGAQQARAFSTEQEAERWTRGQGVRFWNASQLLTVVFGRIGEQ